MELQERSDRDWPSVDEEVLVNDLDEIIENIHDIRAELSDGTSPYYLRGQGVQGMVMLTSDGLQIRYLSLGRVYDIQVKITDTGAEH